FRGGLQSSNPMDVTDSALDIRESDVFVADQSGIHIMAAQGDDSGVPGLPFFAFRDPSVMGSQIAFRASLGQFSVIRTGVFLVDPVGVRPIAVEHHDLAAITLSSL